MITKDDVKKCAKLAKIRFEDDKLDYMVEQLTRIMQVIEDLDDIDTDGVKALTSVLDNNIPTRNDVVTVQNIEAQLFANVPGETADFAKEIKCYVVPKVIE